MINSGYSMHMYCDAHPHYPASYSGRGEAFGRTRREAHAEAKLQGWRIDPRERWCICPECVAAGRMMPKHEQEA